jgi:hypothetical protein
LIAAFLRDSEEFAIFSYLLGKPMIFRSVFQLRMPHAYRNYLIFARKACFGESFAMVQCSRRKNVGAVMSNNIVANQPLAEPIVIDRVGQFVVARYAEPQAEAQRATRAIKNWTIIGLLLMVAGFALLAYQGIRYTLEMQAGGAERAAASRQMNLPLSPLIGISAMFAGYVLIVRDKD